MPIALGLPLLEDLDISWVYGMTNHKLEVLFAHSALLKRLTADGHKQLTTQLFDKMFVVLKVHICIYNIRQYLSRIYLSIYFDVTASP